MKALSSKLNGWSGPLDCDTDEQKSIWHIQALSNRVFAGLQDSLAILQNDADIRPQIGSYQLDMVAFGLRDVENFIDEDGKEVRLVFDTVKIGGAFNIKKVRGDILDKIPRPALIELARRIAELTELSEEEKKSLGFTSGSPTIQ
ncbi:MAG: hypothetical protein HRF49_07645 [bacterium]|jgi:hypothetical protein